MNGYQPKNRCNSCTKQNNCKKYKDGKDACKQYEALSPPTPPKSGSLVMTPQGITYTPPQKQRTVLSVRDFAILMNIANMYISKLENDATPPFYRNVPKEELQKRKDEKMAELQRNPLYQDLLRIRDKLGELNIEVETPSVEVE